MRTQLTSSDTDRWQIKNTNTSIQFNSTSSFLFRVCDFERERKMAHRKPNAFLFQTRARQMHWIRMRLLYFLCNERTKKAAAALKMPSAFIYHFIICIVTLCHSPVHTIKMLIFSAVIIDAHRMEELCVNSVAATKKCLTPNYWSRTT